jgi:branched-chain amino acid transport system substrate-binding protein
MGRHRRMGMLSVLCCAALIAASCGDDDDDDATDATEAADGTEATGDEGTATTGGGGTTTPDGGTGTTTPDGGTGTTTPDGGTGTTAPDGGTDTTTGEAGGDGEVDESVDGTGAAAWAAALAAAESSPLAADDSMEPFVIGMPNLEGDPAGTFPDVREGAEAAVQFINDKLGGIGADLEAGTPGRPIQLEYCGHLVDQNEAQACANQVADANPNTVMLGVDFFSPLMYPLFTEFPVTETLPIFIADFDQPGVISPFGGCPTAFPASAQMIAEIKAHDRLAVIWAQNAPGTECWQDTQERFYQYYADTLESFEFQGFPYTPGETAGYPAVVQQVADYLDGAESGSVYFGIQASDCAAFIQGLAGAGVEAQIYIADSCTSDAVKGLPESNGVIFELQGYLLDQPDLNTEFVNTEMAAREAAIEEYGPETPLTSYTRQAFSGVVFIYQVANDLLASGGDIDDPEALREAYAAVEDYHVVGYRPINCATNPPEYQSVCAHTATYAAWDGSSFTVDEAIPDGIIDVTELMLAVEEAYPRGG